METNNSREREALGAINCINTGGLKRLLAILVEEDIFDGGLINKTIAAVEKAKRALSAPPRNCDVGTAEEQTRRFMAKCKVCNRRDCACGYEELFRYKCAIRWGQLPYEAEEGGAE